MEDDSTLSPQDEALRTLKHDIRNQLSNINLALEQMRYELPVESGDCPFYLDLIKSSCAKINELLKEG
ncbi:hypothetical protein C8P68_10927 [Mucilaginibacter yixingensis]|uniref:Histidine kinase n=1 Tax=Mucilaginibacter yixingensis TaxID=1295612 RepID=A0A2T5J5E6_9SPHI|nr:hypothetical protein [Mucilaginibacter yixingensis]PTQ93155.1 hypothetical protein C8P68_10927 [Mucilaginibacter yixingensis]